MADWQSLGAAARAQGPTIVVPSSGGRLPHRRRYRCGRPLPSSSQSMTVAPAVTMAPNRAGNVAAHPSCRRANATGPCTVASGPSGPGSRIGRLVRTLPVKPRRRHASSSARATKPRPDALGQLERRSVVRTHGPDHGPVFAERDSWRSIRLNAQRTGTLRSRGVNSPATAKPRHDDVALGDVAGQAALPATAWPTATAVRPAQAVVVTSASMTTRTPAPAMTHQAG